MYTLSYHKLTTTPTIPHRHIKLHQSARTHTDTYTYQPASTDTYTDTYTYQPACTYTHQLARTDTYTYQPARTDTFTDTYTYQPARTDTYTYQPARTDADTYQPVDALRLYLINSPVVRADVLKFQEEGEQNKELKRRRVLARIERRVKKNLSN